jgi:flagellar motor switch protein FliM
VFGGVARRLRGQLTTRTGVDSPTSVAALTLTTLGALCTGAAYADAALWCASAITGAENPAYIVFERRLLGRLMGRLFGEGELQTSKPRAGAITEVEQVIGARISRELVEAISGSWSGAKPMLMRPTAVACSRRICADVAPETPYAIVELEISGSDAQGRIFVAIPAAVVETLAPPEQPRKPSLARRVPKFDRVLDVRLELTIELARLEVPVRRLHALKVGDELPLGALAETSAFLSDRRVFFGEPGTSGGLRSFRIKRRLDSPSSPEESDR